MRKSYLILLLLLCLKASSWAQIARDVIPKLIPPSPNAASLEKFLTIPVDYSTGVPNISYPMWSWQRGKLQFGIGLSYHAGGHKVDDMASNVGLGWSLTGVGRVSRTVRGLPDDKVLLGFMYAPSLPAATTYAYNGDEYYYTTPFITSQANLSITIGINAYNSSYSDTVRYIVENQLDGEQDIFSYSCGGKSGRFIIDKNKNIIPLEHTRVKFEMVRNSLTPPLTGESGKIIAFKITDDNGVVYKFEYLEQQYSTTYPDPIPLPAIPDQNYVSGWLLTKIIDPSTQDSIVINYANTGSGNSLFETGFSQSKSMLVSLNGIGNPSSSTSFNTLEGTDLSPTTIDFPDGSNLTFSYAFSREDLLNSKALTKVTLKNYQNSVIKKYQLNYSYFVSGDGTAFPLWAVSDNDFSKRLRLDEIDEVSSDSSEVRPTLFTYNTTQLNARGSMNQDYWGYNVNPSRNNLEYVPKIPLKLVDFYLGSHLDGADRRPDSNYAKAAILEKIEYPTGGFTSFEYESNKAFSSINFFENEVISSHEWQKSDFGTNFTPSIGGRVDSAVTFHFKTIEFNSRPEYDPNEPHTCLEDQQDGYTVRIEIKSLDNTFSTFFEDTYGHFLGGITKVINIPPDKLMRVKFIYDTSDACSFSYPFKATTDVKYYSAPQDKVAGGLRIKKIIFDDGSGPVLTKDFNYNDTDGHSSGVLASIPNFEYYRTGYDGAAPQQAVMPIQYLNQTSSPTNTMSFNGAPLIYTRVKEVEQDSSYTERQYDPLITASNGGTGYYPFLPRQDFPNLSGLLLKQLVKDKNGTIKKEQSTAYNKVQIYLLNQPQNRNLKTGTFSSASYAKYYVVDQYYMYTSRAEPIADTTRVYENGNVLEDIQTRIFDTSNYYVRSISTKTSKNEDRRQRFTYAIDAVGSVYTTMVAKNILSPVITKVDSIPGVSELSKNQNTYLLWGANNVPLQSNQQNSVLGSTLVQAISYDSYDDKGNLLQFTGRDGIVTSFVWGYNKQYPVAKIIGKSYSDAVSQSSLNLTTINAPSSDAAMRTELGKLRSLSSCFVTSYTYKPLVGMTSETDINGRISYYEYDVMNRLKLVKDKDGNIVKAFDYKFKSTYLQ